MGFPCLKEKSLVFLPESSEACCWLRESVERPRRRGTPAGTGPCPSASCCPLDRLNALRRLGGKSLLGAETRAKPHQQPHCVCSHRLLRKEGDNLVKIGFYKYIKNESDHLYSGRSEGSEVQRGKKKQKKKRKKRSTSTRSKIATRDNLHMSFLSTAGHGGTKTSTNRWLALLHVARRVVGSYQ